MNGKRQTQTTRRFLSPRLFARAIGVSESSVKRWVDDARIDVVRTAGGHRRIPIDAGIRFVRETRTDLVHPEILGLEDLRALPSFRFDGEAERALLEFLRSGAEPEARGLIMSLFLDGWSVAEIIDGPIQTAMETIGTMWHDGAHGVFVEHRATDLLIQALSRLRNLQPIPSQAPVAVGGAPVGDPYLIPSAAAASVFASEGFRAVNLGPETPASTLRSAVSALDPRVVWLSISGQVTTAALAADLAPLIDELTQQGIMVVIGGRSRDAFRVPASPLVFYGTSMGELAALARGCARPA